MRPAQPSPVKIGRLCAVQQGADGAWPVRGRAGQQAARRRHQIAMHHPAHFQATGTVRRAK
jgi:hypothetical protein